ncbi:hypothetical protein PF007_g25560 [Phytophthora fragariae]|nr:hypothetical protein PF007_g25560 [Phytophthora fragariae]
MAKLSGSTNYKLSEVRRLLAPVEHYLPLGKYEWERLANSYNANRGRGVAERDHESLRRKFKVLSSARKPTGVAGMASHVQLSKQLKQAIDEKASVVDMDDAADVDQDEEEEYQQDFSFDFEGDEGLEDNTRVLDDADTGVSTTYNDSMHSVLQRRPLPHLRQQPVPVRISLHHSKALKGTRRSRRSPSRKATSLPPPDSEASTWLTFVTPWGGQTAFEDDKELAEASFAKVKRVKAARATGDLKKRLTDLESRSSNMGGSMIEIMMLMREESKRKAEIRRTEEEQRRRDDLASREASYLAEKAETEERSRHEKLEAEERARRDKEDARARTQEVLLILGALSKND